MKKAKTNREKGISTQKKKANVMKKAKINIIQYIQPSISLLFHNFLTTKRIKKMTSHRVNKEIMDIWQLAISKSDEEKIKQTWEFVNFKINNLYTVHQFEIDFLNHYNIISGEDMTVFDNDLGIFNNCSCCNRFKCDLFVYHCGNLNLCFDCYYNKY